MKKQFIIQYANFKMSEIESRNISKPEKIEQMQVVTRCVYHVENGFMTIDECMKTIAEI